MQSFLILVWLRQFLLVMGLTYLPRLWVLKAMQHLNMLLQSTQEELVGHIELFRRMHSTTKGWDNQLVELQYKKMVELQQSQLKLEEYASIMDEASISAKVLGATAGTISGIGTAPRKS